MPEVPMPQGGPAGVQTDPSHVAKAQLPQHPQHSGARVDCCSTACSYLADTAPTL